MNQLTLNTFSITARCKKTGMLGVVVSTARPAVGSLAVYVEAGVGAIATQAALNPYFGIDGLRYLKEGQSAQEVLERLRSEDVEDERRQLAIVSSQGETASYTGKDTVAYANTIEGDEFVVAGNMLVGKNVLLAMKQAYELSENEFLADRLIEAIQAGQDAGGDKRGKQSAALKVVDRLEYPLVDVRADESEDPVKELRRVYQVYKEELFPYIEHLPTRRT